MTSEVVAGEIDRVTLAFNEVEDRISLTCALKDGEFAVVWLTERLLRRLVPHLLQLIADASEILCTEMMRDSVCNPEGAVESARPENEEVNNPDAIDITTPEERVIAPVGSRSGLVAAVDITNGPMLLQLCFRDEHARVPVLLSLEHRQLSQWLESIKRCYVQAGWSMECWEMPASDYPRSLTTRHVALH